MNTLTEAIHEYVGMRQSLGFKLLQVEAWLKDFANFMDTQGETWVTSELALKWATQPIGAQPGHWAKRLTAVRASRAIEVRWMRGPRFPNRGFLRIVKGGPNHTSIQKTRSRIYSQRPARLSPTAACEVRPIIACLACSL